MLLKSLSKHARWSMGCALCVLVFSFLVSRFWHPAYGFTSFLQMDVSSDPTKISAFKEVPVYIYKETGGYDGQYYAQIAYDPSLKSHELNAAMDSLPYRARRILPSVLAYVFALGNPHWIVHVYCALNIIAWFMLAYLVWRILYVDDLKSFIAWAGVLFSAGALASIRLALTDLIALCIIAGAMFAIERNKKSRSAYLFAAAGLCRETSLLSLSAYLDLKKNEPWFTFKRLLLITISILPLGLWLLYIRHQTGLIDSGIGNLSWPVTDYILKWNSTLDSLYTSKEYLLTLTSLLALIGLTTQAYYLFSKLEFSSMWWRLGITYSTFMLFLGKPVWEGFPGAAYRVLLPLTLAFNVIARRRKAGLLLLIVGNLGILSGLLNLKDVPYDNQELFSGKSHGTSSIIRLGVGFYGCEKSTRHTWTWCSGNGILKMTSWAEKPTPAYLHFTIRSLKPCHVSAKINNTLCYETDVSSIKHEGQLSLPATNGTYDIIFSSDKPGVLESENKDARQLAFSLIDVRVDSVATQ